MANLFFLFRGQDYKLRRYLDRLSNMWLAWHVKNGKGEECTQALENLYQPIQLGCLTIPEEHIGLMLRTLNPADHIGIDAPQNTGTNKLKWGIAGLRKVLGLKPFPKWETHDKKGNELPKMPIKKDHINIVGIGWKPDYRDENGNECL